jgi:hypothetical protein
VRKAQADVVKQNLTMHKNFKTLVVWASDKKEKEKKSPFEETQQQR